LRISKGESWLLLSTNFVFTNKQVGYGANNNPKKVRMSRSGGVDKRHEKLKISRNYFVLFVLLYGINRVLFDWTLKESKFNE